MPKGGIFEGSESFDSFAKRNKARAAKLENNTLLTFRRLYVAIGAYVINATPVDTGHARNNWLASIDNPKQGTPNAESKSGSDAITQITSTGIALTLNDVGVIVNNVPYIRRLNAGHSKQAPAGFIEKAAQNAFATVGYTLKF